MSLVFLGTSGATPTVERNLSSTALKANGSVYLFDCPEGTQRQMMKAKISYMKIDSIFLTHFHGDHILGLPGLIATMSMHERMTQLKIFGPKGVGERVKKSLELSLLQVKFEVKCVEVKKAGEILKGENFSVTAFPVKHDVPCFAYVFREKDKEGEFDKKKAHSLGIPEGPLYSRLQKGYSVKFGGKTFKPEQVMDYSKGRKGKKVSIVMDSLPSKSYYPWIRESDVLVHESTFGEKHAERAKETMHSTAKQAGKVAGETKSKKLVLTHFSPRYKELNDLENEARTEFGEVVVAEDLLELEV
ncbi:MAG: ribonuclease Z [Candidatus Diapherotrites archaeon]